MSRTTCPSSDSAGRSLSIALSDLLKRQYPYQESFYTRF
ncbi:hypothetical protein BN903_206 [Halorubrum sp. AJ67]|nr:hypothetical protein BN903_206 [Halorubrum sp. AJ67]